MVRNEWKFIGKNRLILISVLAIMIIPFLYSIFFLKSVWNPYGETQHLPVAVVNNDKAVSYQGKTLSVGDEAVKSLKKDHQLGWRFVSEDKAKQGLKDKKYYTVVTFPKDTSKNAASVLSKNPKKMSIEYETNGSLNYIGEVISQIGASGLNEKIRQTIIKAYADATFSQIKKVGKGMNTAADGAKTLSDGQKTLDDGIGTYTAAVSQVNDGVQTLNMSVAPLAGGVGQLADGGNALNAGLAQLNGSTGQLAGGVGQLNDGANALNGGINQYTNGVSQAQAGLNQLASHNGELLGQLNAISNDPTLAKIAALEPQLPTLMKQINDTQTSMAAANSSIQTLQGLNLDAIKQVKPGDLKALSQAMAGTSKVVAGTPAATQAALDKANAETDPAKKAAILQGALQATHDQFADPTLQKAAAGVGQGSTQVSGMADSIDGLQKQLNNVDMNKINAALANANALMQTANQLKGAAPTQDELSKIQQQVEALKTQMPQIAQYVNGVGAAADGVNKIAANSGALRSGSSQLAGGIGQLNGQIPALTGGVQQLSDGAGQLSGGLNQLNAQIPALTNGVTQLANGTYLLNSNSPALRDGSSQLVTGSVKLSDALGDGAKQVNGLPLSSKTSDMFSAPTKLKHKSYSKVANYGHALAPYVLSVALYVGAVVFNFAYPIRKISMEDQSATAWFFSKATVGLVVAVVQAVAETGLMLLFGLQVDHLGQMFAVATSFSVASMFLVMFLSMLLDNPGRFIAMVVLMLQLGGSGGTFPMQVTNGFYNAIHPFLPMTYSILGLRQGLTSGLGAATAWNAVALLLGMAVLFAILLWLSMIFLQRIHLNGFSQLDDNQKLQEVEK